MIPETVYNCLPRDERDRLEAIISYIDHSDSEVIYEMELLEMLIGKRIIFNRKLLRNSLFLLQRYCPDKYRKVKLDPSLEPRNETE